MAGTIKPMFVVLIAVVSIMSVVPEGEAAVSCGTVVSYLNPCLPYVTGSGALGGCCAGIKGLYGAAQTTADRQSVCNCLKSLAGEVSGVNLGKAAGLPSQCGLSIPYKISPSTDCSKYVYFTNLIFIHGKIIYLLLLLEVVSTFGPTTYFI
ncbi:UNVERIFIED_CONTAM: Non-specific lipid-transfer protein 2 [Sesamum latifolium]|uniref:Non-specific lipid-transfer protein n=1 Tax=Sesamum latifolium TaxID=2727402 RepID=A0AAW2XR05_9LAMI